MPPLLIDGVRVSVARTNPDVRLEPLGESGRTSSGRAYRDDRGRVLRARLTTTALALHDARWVDALVSDAGDAFGFDAGMESRSGRVPLVDTGTSTTGGAFGTAGSFTRASTLTFAWGRPMLEGTFHAILTLTSALDMTRVLASFHPDGYQPNAATGTLRVQLRNSVLELVVGARTINLGSTPLVVGTPYQLLVAWRDGLQRGMIHDLATGQLRHDVRARQVLRPPVPRAERFSIHDAGATLDDAAVLPACAPVDASTDLLSRAYAIASEPGILVEGDLVGSPVRARGSTDAGPIIGGVQNGERVLLRSVGMLLEGIS